MKPCQYNKFLATLPLVCTFLLTSCNSALLNPKGQVGLQERSLILTAFCLMLIVVIPAISMAILFSWKYRSTNINAKYNPNWAHSNKVEAIVWTIPILIILFLAIMTWKSTHTLEPGKPLSSKIKPIEIDVISLDWKWLFIYPKQRIATINEISFPVNTPVYFKVTSNSVMNSFFIPRLGSQIYAMAGMQTNLNLIANNTGIFDGISASFSGHGFSGMKFKAIVTKNTEDFQEWISKVKKAPDTLSNMSDFEKLAIPSENSPVKYFSIADPILFKRIIDKFMTHSHEHSHVCEHEHNCKLHHNLHKN